MLTTKTRAVKAVLTSPAHEKIGSNKEVMMAIVKETGLALAEK